MPNPTDEALYFPREPDSQLENASWRAPFTLMYVGAVGRVQGFDTVLDAAKNVQSKSHIRIVVIGDGIDLPRLAERVEREKIANVTLLGRIDKEQVARYMASSDAQLVTLGQDEFLKHTTPSKIATILASGLPVIAQIAGDGADLIMASGAGLVSLPGDAEALASAICSMAELSSEERVMLGRKGLSHYDVHLSAAAAVRAITAALADCKS